MHISSSLWFIIVATNEKWTLFYNYIYPYTTEQLAYFTSDGFRLFLNNMYMGYFLSTDGEIVPRLESEFFWATAILLLGQVFYSYIMGEISN